MSSDIHIQADAARVFATNILIHVGLPPGDAQIAADVLVRADLRGVMTHGLKNLDRYVHWLDQKQIPTQTILSIVTETPVTATVDGGGGLGMIVGVKAMEIAIEKARRFGLGMVSVRRSRHYGMANYYAMQALPHDMIGISMTNSNIVSVVPTFGNEPMLGTNPISVVAPAGQEPPFEFDMSTSIVAMNRMDLARAKGEKIPFGWGLDAQGNPTDDPEAVWNSRRLLPLGGTRRMSSHKGYGLAMVVDILCGVLAGGIYGNRSARNPSDDETTRASCSHFFAAIRIDAFRPVEEFKADMDDMVRALKESEKAPGQDRIYVPGEIEHELEQERLALGIPYPPALVQRLRDLATEYEVPFSLSSPGGMNSSGAVD